MRHRQLAFDPAATQDLLDAWQIVYDNDGEERADKVFAVIEAFCRSLAEFAEIGTRRDEHWPGLRHSGIPTLKTASVLFLVTPERVTIIRIGYLGRDVWATVGTAAASF